MAEISFIETDSEKLYNTVITTLSLQWYWRFTAGQMMHADRKC